MSLLVFFIEYCLWSLVAVADVAHATLYLLSDKSDMINGTTLLVDGGMVVS